MSTLAATPPQVFELAAHPLRWRLIAELARSDRVVSELTQLTGEPQNLVSYHLAKLRHGGLVSGHKSAADGRDSYYALSLARLSQMLSLAGGALHPGLRLAPPRQDPGVPRGVPGGARPRPARVLFLCTGNGARSPMAAALLAARAGDAVDVMSAGSHPSQLHANAVRVMADDYGLDISAHVPRHFETLDGLRFDWVISLCDRVREVCPEFPGHPEAIHWSLANPVTGEPDKATLPKFRQVAAELSERIGFFLAVLAEPAAA